MNAPDTLDRLRLARTSGVGPVSWRRLIERHGNAKTVLSLLPALARDAGRAEPMVIPTERDAQDEIKAVQREGGQMLFLGDATYPSLLALLADAPPVITVLGEMSAFLPRAVGIVGARNASTNGQRMAKALAHELTQHELIVVSGLARGIDGAAHEGAMIKGRTIAAIAGGIDQPYPPEHADLQSRVAKHGCVITEAPFGAAPQARHFPRRNRLIAGLSLGVVVVEAALRSGSLITARLAQDANRELFAVPGSPLDPRCQGTNDLIRAGAHLTENADDVLANLPDHPNTLGLGRDPLFRHAGMAEADATLEPEPAYNPREAMRRVRTALSASPTPIDEIIGHTKLPTSIVMSALVDLELGGVAELLPGNRAVLIEYPHSM